jgi:hypothetical protein
MAGEDIIRCEAKMTDFDDLKAEVAALRAEVEKWKTITIEVLGKASRAQGFAEGVGEGANMSIRFLTDRIAALENRNFLKPLPFGTTHLAPSPNYGEML